jgi:hypothetical protein
VERSFTCCRGDQHPTPKHFNRPMALIRYEVRYQVPYNACEWRSQWFPTLEEAERMVDFYRSCGSPAHLAA